MNKVLLLFLCILIFILGMSFVSAKEDTHFEIEKDPSGYSVIISLRDSNNNPVPHVKFSIKITKPNGSVRNMPSKPLNKNGQNTFYLGSNRGDYIVHVEFKGNNDYNPTSLTRVITVNGRGGGNSMYDYYDHHNYGDSVVMDDYMYDNYWYEEIYDNPHNFDGEGY